MSTPASRPVHPCVVSLTDRLRGAEFAVWAQLAVGGADSFSSASSSSTTRTRPHLVTASSNSISVYSVCCSSTSTTSNESSTTLQLEHSWRQLAGTVVSLSILQATGKHNSDALLVGFAGHARLTILTLLKKDGNDEDGSDYARYYWQSSTLIDLTSAVTEHSAGAVTPCTEHDIMVSVDNHNDNSQANSNATARSSSSSTTTVACILGGGVAVAVLSMQQKLSPRGCTNGSSTVWMANEPYILPLHTLELPHNVSSDSTSASAAAAAAAAMGGATTAGTSMSTGFGDILHAAFLDGYLEPVLVLLHTSPTGRMGSGRWGSGTPPPCYCTALSISTHHGRTAMLWCVAVPTDATQLVSIPLSVSSRNDTATLAVDAAALVVVAVNSLTFLGAGGRVHQCLAVNGWARSSLSAACALTLPLSPNPNVPLAIQLDGARLSWLSPACAALVLRRGQVYMLQQAAVGIASPSDANKQKKQLRQRLYTTGNAMEWSVLPLGQTLGGMGEIADLVALPLDTKSVDSPSGFDWLLADSVHDDESRDNKKLTAAGFLFAGSRLGDSILLGFALDAVNVATKAESDATKDESLVSSTSETHTSTNRNATGDLSEDDILRLEDEALYGAVANGSSETHPNIIPTSDEDEEDDTSGDHGVQTHKRVRLGSKSSPSQTVTVVRSLHPLDRLVHVGPLGPSCQGPLGRPPAHLTESDDLPAGLTTIDRKRIFAASAHIYPAGYGSSGGLALVTVPGRDDRMIVAEQDCLNAACIFSLPTAGVVLLGMSPKANGGIRVLRLSTRNDETDKGGEAQLGEVYVEEWCTDTVGTGNSDFSDSWEVFQSSLLMAGEGPNGQVFFVVRARDTTNAVLLIAKRLGEDQIELIRHHRIDWGGGTEQETIATVTQVTPIVPSVSRSEVVGSVFGCVWSNGDATLITVDQEGDVAERLMARKAKDALGDDMDLDDVDGDPEARELKRFYSDESIVAVDVFHAPNSVFQQEMKEEHLVSEKAVDPVQPTSNHGSVRESELSTIEPDSVDAMTVQKVVNSYAFDDEDAGLYAQNVPMHRDVGKTESHLNQSDAAAISTYLSVCHRSGALEIFSLESFEEPIWRSTGVSLGVPSASCSQAETTEGKELKHPRSHQISVNELRFFHHGPSASTADVQALSLRRLGFSVVTTEGDVMMYELDRTCRGGCAFRRMPLGTVARTSVEQSRHHAKLARKGVLGRNSEESTLFDYNVLHRFTGISGQDGLFVSGPRPHWFVSERGALSLLAHRTRHAAPAGVKPRPVAGFCSGFSDYGGYMTLHERVGRVGSQRLTLFKGLSGVFDSAGVLSGRGFCVEKIPFGVTVRQIVYLDDESLSTGDHPLYAVLVSRELEADQTELNSDGLTDEERRRIVDEKNAAKVHRQVEADLGGFEVESEWVETIERENCFRVEMDLGGAPPIQQSVYSLWIVDAANDWLVVDSFEFEEYEHGIDLQAMSLTEFVDVPGSGSATAVASADSPKRHFLAVGTGVVNHDGEDVSTKGRLLLFDVRRLDEKTALSSTTVAELTLAYEKNIFHGPVTTASCLSSEGMNRLVIGAGSDVNIEQWGNGKLTQVGFFRATMHILDILHFKNFLLLSDAYDSLYFLVWRESDKSLTMLAKDYDPIPVHAAGVMARGAAMTFLCHDDRQNLQFFQYAPGEAAARGGNKLVCRADFHLGSQTTSFRSHFCQPSLLIHSATPASTLSALKQQDALFGRQDDDQRLGVHFGTTDGGMGSIVPLSEPVYWRMMALQSVMANALDSDCALNQRAWRLYRRTPRRGGCRSNDRKRGAIDGDLVLQYANLATTEQEDLASAIGSTVGLILDNLLEIQSGGMIM